MNEDNKVEVYECWECGAELQGDVQCDCGFEGLDISGWRLTPEAMIEKSE